MWRAGKDAFARRHVKGKRKSPLRSCRKPTQRRSMYRRFPTTSLLCGVPQESSASALRFFLPRASASLERGLVNLCLLTKHFLVPLRPHEESLQNHRRARRLGYGCRRRVHLQAKGRRSVDNQTLRQPATPTQTKKGAMRLSPQFPQTGRYPH